MDDDKFQVGTGQAHELALAFGRNGWTNADIKRLSEGDLLARLLPVVRGEDEVKLLSLPTEMTLDGVVYDILPILRGKEESIPGKTMVARAKEMNAHQGKAEREHLLAHQGDIPVALQGKIVFVFTDDPRPDRPGNIAIVCWSGGRWVQYWYWLVYGWNGDFRVLRRKSPV